MHSAKNIFTTTLSVKIFTVKAKRFLIAASVLLLIYISLITTLLEPVDRDVLDSLDHSTNDFIPPVHIENEIPLIDIGKEIPPPIHTENEIPPVDIGKEIPPPVHTENEIPPVDIGKEIPPPVHIEKEIPTIDIGNESPPIDIEEEKLERLEPVNQCNSSLPTSSQEERFLTYFPHSGFHNQWIEVENAIFLAWYTNRTLILPPILFGGSIPWEPTWEFLQDFARIKSNFTIEDCEEAHKNQNSKKKKCFENVRNITLLAWDELFDLSFIKKHVRVIEREDFSMDNLLKRVNITDPDREMYLPQETERYSIRYHDVQEKKAKNIRLKPFSKIESLCTLYARPEKLLHFSSLFGASRLVIRTKINSRFREGIKENMMFNNPVLANVIDDISDRLGGMGNYVGTHLRIGGNPYSQWKETTVQKMIEKLLDFTQQQGVNPLDLVVFVATDAPHDIALDPLRSLFPRAITLETFMSQLVPLHAVINPADDVSVFKHLVPIADLLVSAHGNPFFGTETSTFSKHAAKLNSLFKKKKVF